MLPEFIEKCFLESNDTAIRYNFVGNAAFATFLCRNTGQQLYGDSDLLTDDSATIETDTLICYLELDRETRLPIASGISYIGIYQKEGLPYSFTYEASQTYQYGIS